MSADRTGLREWVMLLLCLMGATAHGVEKDSSVPGVATSDVPQAGSTGIRLVFKEGSVLESKAFKETDSHIQIDLAGQKVSFKKEDILYRFRIGDTENALYYSSDLPTQPRTLPELTQQVEGAVVTVRHQQGLGAGVLIHPDGFLITNAHVVKGAYDLSVSLFARSKGVLKEEVVKKVKIMSISDAYNLALLKLEIETPRKLPYAPLGDSTAMAQGSRLFAVERSTGPVRRVLKGSLLNSVPRAQDPNKGTGRSLLLKTSIQTRPEHSGTPLFNMRGEVAGINNVKNEGAEGLGFAVPSAFLKIFIEHRESFVFDPSNPENGFEYLPPASASAEKEKK